VRIALVPLNPTVGNLAGNRALMCARIDEVRTAGANLVAFPELALCGYPPRDLLTQQGFVEACAREAKTLGEGFTRGITCVFGTPSPVDTKDTSAGVHNSLLVYRDGALVGYYDKRLLPTYDVFDEDRYFTAGSRPVVVDVPSRDGRVMRVGLAICEDLWKGVDAGFARRYDASPDPVADVVRAGAEVVLASSASPFVLGKGRRHADILRAHARAHGVTTVGLNQLGGNDELVFDGHRIVVDRSGQVVGEGELFSSETFLFDVLGAEIVPVRGPAQPYGDERQLYEALVLGVRDYLRKTGFRSALIGLSGGVDSALTAALAVAALGADGVRGVAMPGPYSSAHSVEDARDLALRMGIACETAPIEPAMRGLRETIDPLFARQGLARLGEKLPDVTEENLQSRIRGTLLMTLSNRTGAMVLTTGNKSETAVGYATLYGDMNGGLAVLSDVSKQWVYRLSRWINANWRSLPGLAHCGREPIPARTIEKAPSAELRPNQTDQDSLPPYDVLDRVIDLYVEGRRSPGAIARETGFERSLIDRVVRMIDLAEYKRRQAAVGLKVTSVAFGTGRRRPIAQGWRHDLPLRG
jgi:NAD+ synthetase